jgi:hypothetical protein
LNDRNVSLTEFTISDRIESPSEGVGTQAMLRILAPKSFQIDYKHSQAMAPPVFLFLSFTQKIALFHRLWRVHYLE